MANAYIDKLHILNSGRTLGVSLIDAAGSGSPVTTTPTGGILTLTINGNDTSLTDIIWDSALPYVIFPLPSSLSPITPDDTVSFTASSGWATTSVNNTVLGGTFSVTNLVGKTLDSVDPSEITMPIGVNLEVFSYYNTIPYYNDITKGMAGWQTINNSVIDEKGYLVSATKNVNYGVVTNITNYVAVKTGYPRLPEGLYDIEYSDFSSPPVVTNTSQYFTRGSGSYVTQAIFSSKGPCKNLKIFQPGSDKSQRFNSHILDKIGTRSTLRFMDVWATNHANMMDMSDITPVDLQNYTTDKPSITANVVSVDTFDDPYNQITGGGWSKIKINTDAPHNFHTGMQVSHVMSSSGVMSNGLLFKIGNLATVVVLDETSYATQVFTQQTSDVVFIPQNITGTATAIVPLTMPLEDLVAMCNVTKSDMWFNIPYLFVDDAMEYCFQYIANNLDPDLKVYLEYGNEHWNLGLGFYLYWYCLGQGALMGIGPSQWYAYKSALCHDLAYPYLGDRMVRLFASWYNSPRTTKEMMEYAYSVGLKVDAVAIAPYVNNLPLNQDFGALYDSLSDEQIMDIYEMRIYYGEHYAMVTSHNNNLHYRYPKAKIVSYEGGPQDGGLSSAVGTDDKDQLRINYRAIRSNSWAYNPRMNNINTCFLKRLQDGGMTLFMDFILTYPLFRGNVWGIYNAYNQLPGKGDGSDGLFDNRTDYTDLDNRVSVVGYSINQWNTHAKYNAIIRQGLSDHMSNSLRDFIFRSKPVLEKPTGISLALVHGEPNHLYNYSIPDEIAEPSYQRQPLSPSDVNWDGSVDGLSYNKNLISFGPATETWGWVSGVVFVDSSIIGSGNVLSWGILGQPEFINIGQEFKIAPSGIGVSFI